MALLKDLIVSGSARILGTLQAKKVKADSYEGITLSQIGAAPSTVTRLLNATINASSWSGSAPYTQTVSVSGVSTSDNPIIGLNIPSNTTAANEKLIRKAYGCLSTVVTNNGSITLYCISKKPVTNFQIYIKGV